MEDRMGILLTTKPLWIKDEEKAYKDKFDKHTIEELLSRCLHKTPTLIWFIDWLYIVLGCLIREYFTSDVKISGEELQTLR